MCVEMCFTANIVKKRRRVGDGDAKKITMSLKWIYVGVQIHKKMCVLMC